MHAIYLTPEELRTLNHCVSDEMKALYAFSDSLEAKMDSSKDQSIYSFYLESFTNLSNRLLELESIKAKASKAS